MRVGFVMMHRRQHEGTKTLRENRRPGKFGGVGKAPFGGITLLLKFEEYTGFNVIMRWRNFLAEGRELQEMRSYESSNTYII